EQQEEAEPRHSLLFLLSLFFNQLSSFSRSPSPTFLPSSFKCLLHPILKLSSSFLRLWNLLPFSSLQILTPHLSESSLTLSLSHSSHTLTGGASGGVAHPPLGLTFDCPEKRENERKNGQARQTKQQGRRSVGEKRERRRR
ncbi:hypothetical protein CSUI_001169, partial [Cystoisospora suis]